MGIVNNSMLITEKGKVWYYIIPSLIKKKKKKLLPERFKNCKPEHGLKPQ